MSNLTDFTMQDIPTETRQALAARARQQTIEKYGLPSHIFARAEAIVEAGHVQLTGRNIGMVYDESNGWRGWLAVTLSYCGHCGDEHRPVVCVHKLAISYADLLARHLPDDPSPATGAAASARTAPGVGVAGPGGGRYSGPLVSARFKRRRGKTSHCKRCGAFLCADGSCTKCGGAR